jgi:hypothetical protein
VIDDPVDSLIVRNEGDDLHEPAALRAEQRVDLVAFPAPRKKNDLPFPLVFLFLMRYF